MPKSSLEAWKDFCELMYLHFGRFNKTPARKIVKSYVIGDEALNCQDYRCIRKYIGYYPKRRARVMGHSTTVREKWKEGILEELGWIRTDEKMLRGMKVRVYIFPDPHSFMGAKAPQISTQERIKKIREEIAKDKTT